MKKDVSSMVREFEAFINNPLSKKTISKLNHYCDKCEATHLQCALDYYLGIREDICHKCKLVLPIVKQIIKKGLNSFNTSEEALISTMQDPYWRKGLLSVIKGMGNFGVHKPFVPGAPFQIVWNITKACNFKCIHCYENAGKKADDELTTDEIIDGIDKLSRLGVASIAFSGGEPTVHPGIIDLIKYASEDGMYVSMATNGFKTAKIERAKEFADAGLEFVQISLDGLNSETHDNFRGVPNSWNRAVQSIKNFLELGVFVEVSTTVTQENYDEIPGMIDFMRELGVEWFMLYNFIPTGSGSEVKDLDLTPKQRNELLKLIYEENGKGDMQILSTAPQFADVAVSMESDSNLVPTHFFNPEYTNPAMKELADFVGGCGAGRFYMSVEPNGDMFPCVFFPHDDVLKLGNIKDADLEDMWCNNELLLQLRNKDLLASHCGVCESRYICGGCRARAYAYNDCDYLGPDPGCLKNQT
ncbi:radical SAM/SPASM domain-containing protein [Methanobrevibacter woesei]|uniref:radical SAM/SPASM domain-containing protein n=1 Tax=Methanobrevibacter woesei TaxID=190976 RepID=UPI0023F5475D|nr:radical SAM protein [Methanobrevibacter woesei]MCI7291847.1 radical SAM protein [Methanobrevibacter woesei]